MADEREIAPEMLRQLLALDEATGRLYWKPRGIEWFEHVPEKIRLRQCNRWNSLFAHKEAFTSERQGYRRTRFMGRNYCAHRVVWALVHGYWPGQVDHINRDRGDNRPANLREVSNEENARNQRLRTNNRSGVTGVHWRAREQRWIAKINANGKQVFLGGFETFDEAAAARRAAERKYGYRANHGT